MTRPRRRMAGALISAAVTLAGCTSPSGPPSAPTGGGWATTTSAQEGGGIDALVAAARAEGALNVIGLAPTWTNYGTMITTFAGRYGIKVVAADPTGTSQDEIDAVTRLGREPTAPDVLDVGQSFANGHADLYAPYRVTTWDSIPAVNKDPNGTWVNDYGGFVSIGCNAAIVKVCPTTLADLTRPGYRNQIALNGSPTQAASAFASVWAGALANHGSLDDIAPGIAFWAQIAKSGNLLRIDPDDATIQTGRTPIVLDWDYLNVTQTAKNRAAFDWKVAVPPDGLFAQYYAQAINRNAPHPAAARLWQEFLYSDQGQNLWLAGMARPVRLPAMMTAGTADMALVAVLPPVTGEPRYPTQAQTDAAQMAVAREWAAATS